MFLIFIEKMTAMFVKYNNYVVVSKIYKN